LTSNDLIYTIKGCLKSQEVLVVFVDYFLLFLWVGLVLVDVLGLSLVDILGNVFDFGFILGFINVFGDIDTLFNDGGLFYVVYLKSTAREKNSSDKSKKYILH
jgi:hypothetical protein